MVLRKRLDQYVSSYQRWIKSVIRLGNHEVLKTLTFVDADANANANADAGGSTIALPERCSGELKGVYSKRKEFASHGSKFFPFRVDLFSKENKHAEKQTWSHKSCLLCKKRQKMYQYPKLSHQPFIESLCVSVKYPLEFRWISIGYYAADCMSIYQPNHCWWLCFTL